MIIDWTYGATAQVQGYICTALVLNNSSVQAEDSGVIFNIEVSTAITEDSFVNEILDEHQEHSISEDVLTHTVH